MAGVGEASAIISLIQAASWVVGYAQDVIKAQDERQRLLKEMGRFTLILGSIYDRLKDYQTKANSTDTWYTNLLILAQGCGTIQVDGSIKPWPGSISKPEGALARLQIVIGQLLMELQPAHGMRKAVQTLKYTWDKDKFDDLLSDITALIAEIGALLDADQFKLLISLKDDETSILKQLKDVQDRVDLDSSRIQKLVTDSEASMQLGEDTNVKVSDISDRLKTSEASNHQGFNLIKDNLLPIRATGLKNLHVQRQVKRHVVDTNERVRMIEARQRQEHEEREREREEKRTKELQKEKEEIQEWLSPLRDLARQYEISGQCYPLGQWLLDSVAFKQWAQGRPWYLQLDGEAGSGKVGCAGPAFLPRLTFWTDCALFDNSRPSPEKFQQLESACHLPVPRPQRF